MNNPEKQLLFRPASRTKPPTGFVQYKGFGPPERVLSLEAEGVARF
jgi:hypothetical protein